MFRRLLDRLVEAHARRSRGKIRDFRRQRMAEDLRRLTMSERSHIFAIVYRSDEKFQVWFSPIARITDPKFWTAQLSAEIKRRLWELELIAEITSFKSSVGSLN